MSMEPANTAANARIETSVENRWLKPVGMSVMLLAVLIWCYWSTLAQLWREWQRDQNYSVGQLVPLATAYMLWVHRRRLARCRLATCWWGLGVILLAQLARTYGQLFLFESAERYALVLTVWGLVLLLAGWDVVKTGFWPLLFLCLMVPLPGKIHNMISTPLQSLSTQGAFVTLELLGVIVTREGNTLMLNHDTPVAVAEACSGLRMLTAFVVVAGVFAFIIDRPGWQKAIIVLSSVPIAILCNLIRLVATAGLFLYANSRIAESFFHDFAGLTMMPMAVMILMAELWILNWVAPSDD